MHYYSFNIGDYTSSTQHLEPMEDLAYRRMLDLYYSKELPLPKEVEKIARLIRMRSHTDSIAIVLEEFFTKEKDGYHNKGADKALGKVYKKSKAARKSAEARWSKNKDLPSCERNANASEPHCEEDANGMLPNTQYPIPNTQDKKTISTKADGRPNELFQYWASVMKKTSSTKFSPKRKRAVEARLKDGYQMEEIKQAIFNCSNTPHNMGFNDRNQKFDDLELICRNAENLERFRDNSGAPNETNQPRANASNASGLSSAQSAIAAARQQRDAAQSGSPMGFNERTVHGQVDSEEWSGRVYDVD